MMALAIYVSQTLSLPVNKLRYIKDLFTAWAVTETSSLQELESLFGLVNLASKVVHPGVVPYSAGC